MKRFPILVLVLLLLSLSACSGKSSPMPLPIETAAPATNTAELPRTPGAARTPVTPAAQPTVAPTLASQLPPRPTSIIADIPAFQGIDPRRDRHTRLARQSSGTDLTLYGDE